MSLNSMTGFGRSEGSVGNRQIAVELKSLNGKQLEINTRISPLLRPYEPDIRALLSTALQRGSVDVNINVKQDGASRPMTVNTALARYYFEAMQQISAELQLPQEQILPTLMNMPEVVNASSDVLSEHEWLEVKVLVQNAVRQLQHHRSDEGQSLYADLIKRITQIETLLTAVAPHEPGRLERIRGRIRQNLQQSVMEIDENRFEAELIYYLEKMDFSEEVVRLSQHCHYFKETMEKPTPTKGKVLGFILQEIGREINTLGSKANDASIQQIVVLMKDELEKAKEQVLNVL